MKPTPVVTPARCASLHFFVAAASVLLCALAAGAQATSVTPEHPQALEPRVPDSLADELLALSAADFLQHGPLPQAVRNVHVRYAQTDAGERSYLLCGEFAQAGAGPPRWTAFATIKTDPYEQWLGGQAQAFCERALPLAESPEDLSQALQARLAEADR